MAALRASCRSRTHADEIVAVTRGYGDGQKPEDFLDSFAAFVRDNINTIAALKLVVQRPRDLTRADLKELRLALDREGLFGGQSAPRLGGCQERGHRRLDHRLRPQAALGDPLMPYDDRVRGRDAADHGEPPVDRAAEALAEADWRADRERDRRGPRGAGPRPFIANGGFNRLNKVFGGELENVLAGINEEMWKKTA